MLQHERTNTDPVGDGVRVLGPYLLGVALFATSGTQLRFLPAVGPGELLLAAWLVLEALHLRDRPLRAPRPVASLWLALSAGTLIATLLNLGSVGIGTVARTSANMILVGASLTAIGSLPNPRPYLRRASITAAIGFIATSGVLYLLKGSTRTVGPIVTFSADGYGRFQGWADNPNTTAFYSLGLCLFVALTFDRPGDRWVQILTAIPLARLGLATDSDGFRLALIVTGVAIATLSTFTHRNRAGLARIAVRIVLLSTVVFVIPRVYAIATDMAQETIEQQNQAEVRLNLWNGCLQTARSSPIVGKGPGGHGGDGPGNVAMECHNTYLELLSSGGVLPVLFLVAALVAGLCSTLRRGNFFAGSILIGTSVAFLFAMYLRMPLYWMLLVIAIGPPAAFDDKPGASAVGRDGPAPVGPPATPGWSRMHGRGPQVPRANVAADPDTSRP